MRGLLVIAIASVIAGCWTEEPYGQRSSTVEQKAAPAKVEPAKAEPAPEPVPAPDTAAMPEGEPPPAVRVEPKSDAVTVVDAGAEPRQPLRLAPRVGDEQRVELRMQMTIGMTLGDRQVPATPMPEVTVVLASTVKSTGDTIRYDFTVAEARRSEGEFSDRVLRAVDQAVQAMQQTKGTFAIDARGIFRDAKIDSPELPTPGLRPSLTGFQQSFGQLYPSLPDEPIGVGAKWNAISHFDLGGVPIQQEAAYALLRREGDEIELSVSFTQAASSAIDAPGEIQMNVTSFGGRGDGTVTLHLAKVAPLKGSTHSRSLTVSTLEVADRQNVTMDMTLDLHIDGSK
jgi:hypothetical protein